MECEEFLQTARQARALLARDAVVRSWEEPSALAGYTIAGLAGHLGRGMLTTYGYVSQAIEDPVLEFDDTLPDAAAYFARVLGYEDPVESDLHRAIRQRSMSAITNGHAQLLTDVDAALSGLAVLLPQTQPQQPVRVLDMYVMRADDYIETRLVELVVHMDDLVSSLDADQINLDTAVLRRVAEILIGVAVVRDGAWPTIRSLARRERQPEAVRAF